MWSCLWSSTDVETFTDNIRAALKVTSEWSSFFLFQAAMSKAARPDGNQLGNDGRGDFFR